MFYQIRIQGHLTPEWSDWFGGLTVENDEQGAVLSGRLADKAALYGVLNQIQALNLTLISVTSLPETAGDEEANSPPEFPQDSPLGE